MINQDEFLKINQKLIDKLNKVTGCINCPYFKRDTYQDMQANIPYVNCKLGYFKEDGRSLHDKFYIFNYGNWNYSERKPFLYKNCKLIKKRDYQSKIKKEGK